MARTPYLQGIHDKIYLGNIREPIVMVLLYDETDSISDIVLSKASQKPLDLTKYVVNCSISESEDTATTASFTINPGADLSPYMFNGRSVLRILYADKKTSEEYETPFFVMFTGVSVGQPGYVRSRTGSQEITVKAIDRSFFYNKRTLQSPDYVKGTDLGDVVVDIATNSLYGMGLEREEVRSGLFRKTVPHTTISFFDIPYTEALNNLGFLNGRKVYWDSEGFLEMRDVSLEKPPVRVYDDESMFFEIRWPQNEVDLNNCVRIVGLSDTTTKVTSPFQPLDTVRGTIGYFQKEFTVKVFFSEDRQGRAENVVVSDYNINGNLSFLSSGKPKLKKLTEFGCTVVIEAPYNAYIFVAFFAVYIAFFAVQLIPVFGKLVQEIALLAAAVWLTAGLAIMQQLGTFEATISGTPFKYVYKEVVGEACLTNLADYEVRTLEIENHLVSNEDLANELAKRELKKEVVKGNVREFSIPFDPVLEITDIIELPDGTRYQITSLNKSFKRNEAQDMGVSAIMIRSGKEYKSEAGYPIY